MTRLYDRKATLTVAQPITLLGKRTKNAVLIEDLRVSFKIRRDLSKEPNTAEIKIYNLAEQTRAEFQGVPRYVRLDAGYRDSLARLFVGDVRHASSELDGTEWVTTLEVGDSERAFRRARVNRSLSAGARVRDAVTETIRAMGSAVPSAVYESAFSQRLPAGESLSGIAHRELTRLLDPMGYGWSLQDGQVQILKSTGVNKDQAIEISQEAGMIGTAELGDPENEGGAPTLSVETLLEPRVRPGGRIVVKARNVPPGVYKVIRVDHVGDTEGEDWKTKIEAKTSKARVV